MIGQFSMACGVGLGPVEMKEYIRNSYVTKISQKNGLVPNIQVRCAILFNSRRSPNIVNVVIFANLQDDWNRPTNVKDECNFVNF